MYAFQATIDDIDDIELENDRKLESINEKLSDLSAFTAQIKQFYENNKWEREHHNAVKDGDSRYKWKS